MNSNQGHYDIIIDALKNIKENDEIAKNELSTRIGSLEMKNIKLANALESLATILREN